MKVKKKYKVSNILIGEGTQHNHMMWDTTDGKNQIGFSISFSYSGFWSGDHGTA